jgi:uncharacterized protein YjbI with pentapeptide repeats
LVAGEVDYAMRNTKSLWSNRLVLSSSGPGERIKVGRDGKIVVSPETFPLRGRRLEGAVILDAHLKGTDLTGANLSGADFTGADLREVKFGCEKGRDTQTCAQLQGARFDYAQLQNASLDGVQLQGASLNGAQLQGASLDGAQLDWAELVGAQLQGASLRDAKLRCTSLYSAELQGASLRGAQLEGASLRGAQLQGASLDDAELQGANLRGAQLQAASLVSAQLQGVSLQASQLEGASLNGAQLLGASLDGAGLQGASLQDVFVWRARPPTSWQVEGALISGLTTGPESWTKESYAELKARMETVPRCLSPGRDRALGSIEILGEKPYEEDAKLAQQWRALAAESRSSAEAYQGEMAKALIRIGCGAERAPYVISGLIQQLDSRLGDSPARWAEVARAFLDEASCPGARGLSEESRAKLRKMRPADPPSLTTLSPER